MKKIRQLEEMDFYIGPHKNEKNEALINVDKFYESINQVNIAKTHELRKNEETIKKFPEEINVDKKNEVIVNLEKLKRWFDDFYGEYDNRFLSVNCLSEEELKRIEQGMLEIDKGQFVSVKEYIPTGGAKAKQDFRNDGKKGDMTPLSQNHFLVNSFAYSIRQDKSLLKENFSFFHNFLDDLFNKKNDIDFKEYLLSKNDRTVFLHTDLKPYRYLYKDSVKILSLVDDINNKTYILGFATVSPFRSDLFLKKIMYEKAKTDPYNLSPMSELFFSLEISVQDAAKLLSYTHIDVKNLLDSGEIYSRNPTGEHSQQNSLAFIKDPRLIPLTELYAYMEKSDIKNKQERIDELLKYIDQTAQAAVNKLDESKMPHPLDGNSDYLYYKNECARLKRNNPTKTDRDHYISIIVPVISKIVEIVESKDFKQKKHNLIDKTDFIKTIYQIDNDYPIQGEVIGQNIFKALPDRYKYTKKGRQEKTFDWVKELTASS